MDQCTYTLNMIRRLFIRIFPLLGLQLIFFKSYGRFARVKNPVGLYEKLIWMNFNDRNEERTRLADKLLVRDHLLDLGLGRYLNDILSVYDSPDDIDFSKIPDCCMLKCNHGANYNIHVHDFDQADIKKARRKLRRWMRSDYSLNYAELHYSDIPRKIICEKYLGHDLYDYKVYCINGQPEYVMVCTNRKQGDTQYYFYDFDWDYKDLLTYHLPDPGFERPPQLEELYELTKKLSAGWPFVRVDTYIHDGRIIFGEMTFTPSGFIDKETLPEVKMMLGKKLILPKPDEVS